jgi:transposase
MNKISVIGLDLAKNVFQVHGVDSAREVVVRKQLKRSQVRGFFTNVEPCLVGMEACGGAHYWSRELSGLGHTVRMIAPIFVKPYLKTNKNDRMDAEAICEAAQRPSMRFVQPKTPEQQCDLHLHRARRLRVRQRVALGNHLRGILSEYGIVLAQGVKALSGRLPARLEDAENDLPMLTRDLLAECNEESDQLMKRIERLEGRIKAWHVTHGVSQRLASIPGIGVLTASALAATVGEGQDFSNGRQLAAYLGLVPRQASSGGSAPIPTRWRSRWPTKWRASPGCCWSEIKPGVRPVRSEHKGTGREMINA